MRSLSCLSCTFALSFATVVAACSSDPTTSGASASSGATASANAADAGALTFTDGTSPFACTKTGISEWPIPGGPALAAFREATGLDYVAAHALPMDGQAPSTFATSGTPCTEAPCAAALAALTGTTALYTDDAAEFGTRYPGYWLATTKGNTARAIASLDDLRSLTPVIDGPAKAYFWAEAQGWRVECGEPWYRAVGDAHELAVSRLRVPCQPRETAIVRVARDGTVTVLATGEGSAACL